MRSKKIFKFLIVILIIVNFTIIPNYTYADTVNIVFTNQVEETNTTPANTIDTVKLSENYQPNIQVNYDKTSQKDLATVPDTGCKAIYLAEPITGKVLYEKNAHELMYPASTTKLLTALVVLERCNLTDTVTVSQNAIDLVPTGYSNAGLRAGEEFTVSQLLYALLIPSANEAANVLAEYVGGTIQDFAEICNLRAKELGCENLHFVNPNGIHDDNHYCSAYDLYLIAKECQKYELFNTIVASTSYTLPTTNKYTRNDRSFNNTNALIIPSTRQAADNYYYQYCTGMKTGYTSQAGNCLVASSTKDDLSLICVVLGGGTNEQGLNERFYDTIQLLDFAYGNYSIKEVSKFNQTVKNIEIKNGTKDTKNLDLVVDTDIATIMPNDLDINNIQKEIKVNDELVAPISEGDVVGTVTFKVDGLEYTTNLLASHTVEKQTHYVLFTIIGLMILITMIIVIKKFKKKK